MCDVFSESEMQELNSREVVECEICKVPFFTTHYSQARFCSDCSKRRDGERIKEWYRKNLEPKRKEKEKKRQEMDSIIWDLRFKEHRRVADIAKIVCWSRPKVYRSLKRKELEE